MRLVKIVVANGISNNLFSLYNEERSEKENNLYAIINKVDEIQAVGMWDIRGRESR